MTADACTPVILKRPRDLWDQAHNAARAGDAAAVDHFFGPLLDANPSDDLRAQRARLRRKAGDLKGAYADCSAALTGMQDHGARAFKTVSAWCAEVEAQLKAAAR